MTQRHLYRLQRLITAILVPLVIGLLAVMIYAQQVGRGAAQIQGQTRALLA